MEEADAGLLSCPLAQPGIQACCGSNVCVCIRGTCLQWSRLHVVAPYCVLPCRLALHCLSVYGQQQAEGIWKLDDQKVCRASDSKSVVALPCAMLVSSSS